MVTSPVSPAPTPSPPLLGRAAELTAILGLLDGLRTEGRGLVIEGETGVGKTALVEAVVEEARRRGHRILRCTGLRSSATIGYTALHELLHPILPFAKALPPRHRSAILGAFGLDDAEAEFPLVALGALGLVEEAAAQGPVLIAVEDADWLDDSSAQVLGFVGAQLSAGPALALATRRPGGRRPAAGALPWETLTLNPLTDDEARLLLERIAADLPAGVRDRIREEAAGNPLALNEFATAVRRFGIDQLSRQPWLPLTDRLEKALLHQLEALPAGARQLLLVAAAAGTATLLEVMAAGALLGLDLDDLDRLETSDLVVISGPQLRLRHPSLRSVMMETSSTVERLRVHRALGQVTTDPFAAAWHRSNATLERNEKIAAGLEAAAQQTRSRGALPEAKSLYHRAALHSPSTDDRARRLAQAAETARSAGLIAEVEPLLDEAESLATEAATLVEIAVTRTSIGLTAGVARNAGDDLLALGRRLTGPSAPEQKVRLLWLAALNARGRALPRQDWQHIEAELRATVTTSPLKPVALALLAPLGEHAELRAELAGLVPRLLDFPLGMMTLAIAAESLQDLETAVTCWGLSHELFRAQGKAVDESQALRGRATLLLLRGRIQEAVQDATHALRLAEDTGMLSITAMATSSLARAHALIGDAPAAGAAIQRCVEVMGIRPVALASADVRWAKGLLALHTGQHRDALIEFMHVSVHPTRALWVVADATEAAVRAQRAELVRGSVARAGAVARAYSSSHLNMLVQRSQALLAVHDGTDPDPHFTAAVESGQLSQSPLELARTRLLYGEWLRRERRDTQARRELSDALAVFTEIGAIPFVARATAELQAAGQARAESDVPVSVRLTPQELQVARLAAEGMSNKEIADRAHLSHRTVGAHLYRAFPKLGITRRTQLRDALARAGGHGTW